MEVIQSQQLRTKYWKKKINSSQGMWDNTKMSNIFVIKGLMWSEKILEEIMAKNFLNLAKDRLSDSKSPANFKQDKLK